MPSIIRRGITELITKVGSLAECLALAGKTKVQISSSAPYTDFVIHGTAPHMIYPKDAQALANMETGFGPVAQVHHPGTKPNDFVDRARTKVRPLLIREYTSMIGEGLFFGYARAEAAKITVGETLLRVTREEAPKDTGTLARGLGLVGSIGDLL